MAAHKHAELMMKYAQDALTNEYPWTLWQWRIDSDSYENNSWEDCSGDVPFHTCKQYRRKPQFIDINGYEVPKPVSEPLEAGDTYWIISFRDQGNIAAHHWNADSADIIFLESGIIHRSPAAAGTHAKALLSFTTNENDL